MRLCQGSCLREAICACTCSHGVHHALLLDTPYIHTYSNMILIPNKKENHSQLELDALRAHRLHTCVVLIPRNHAINDCITNSNALLERIHVVLHKRAKRSHLLWSRSSLYLHRLRFDMTLPPSLHVTVFSQFGSEALYECI